MELYFWIPVGTLFCAYMQILDSWNIVPDSLFQSRLRLAAKTNELEEVLHEYENRLEEEEAKIDMMMEDRKKFGQNIQDLEDQ